MIGLSEIFNLKSLFHNWFKKLLLIFVLIPFLFIYVQQLKPIVSLKPLKGYFIPKTYDPCTFTTWFNGEYQHKTETYLNDEFGFRKLFLRLYNQIKFSFFKKANAEGVVVGKNNFLYEIGYIDTYYGGFFLGEKALQDSVSTIKHLQDTLKSLGKELLIVLAPSKARVYPEYIPDYLRREQTKETNYNYYTEFFNKERVNYLDFNPIFQEKKKNSEFLLFPQLGVHWSRYEAVLAADTIIKHIAWLTQTNLPQLKITNTLLKDTLEAPDNDVVEGMNLLFYPPFKKMRYPEIEIDTINRTKNNLIVISDSYWWDIYLRDIPKQVFKINEFWYYNKEIYGSNYLGKTSPDKIDIKRHLLKSDCIVLLCTESNLSRIGFGFIGMALNYLRTTIEATKEELEDIKKAIQATPDWDADIRSKAKERKNSYEDQLTADANWYFQRKGPLHQDFTIDDISSYIKTDSIWFKEIRNKAIDRKISIDSMVKEDAIWYYKNVLKKTKVDDTKKDLSPQAVRETILHNNVWMEQIRAKAKKEGISVDSMITKDVLWFIHENENK